MDLGPRNNSSKSNANCCVFGCKSIRKTCNNLSYHSFPKSGKENVTFDDAYGGKQIVDRRKAWEMRLKMGKRVSTSMKVCSLHFKKEDYYYAELWHGNKRLLPNAVPSQHLPIRSHDTADAVKKAKEVRAASRLQRLQDRRKEKENESKEVPLLAADTCIVDKEPEDVVHKDIQVDAAETLLLLSEGSTVSAPFQPAIKEFRDFGVQVNFDVKEVRDCEVQVNTSEMVTVCDFIESDVQLNSLTGLHSLQLIHTVVNLVSYIVNDKRIHRLSLYKRVLLCFMKMKLDLPYVILAVLFGVSSQTCKTIFFDLVPKIAQIVGNAIQFSSSSEIKRNMPKCFKEYKNVRIILDCTEVNVQKSKRLCCKIKLYSHYKGTTTIKFMTGVNPAGLITFVSKAYGGRTSDKAIFEKSNLIDKLTMHEDEIMVDKGFLIEDTCESYGIKLVRPAFLRKKKQFSHEEAILNAKIASARVHVERANQRIKIFRILTNCVPITLVPLINEIFVIACGVANMSNPILADDKFIV